MKVCILTSGHEPDDGRIYDKEIKTLKKLGYTDITIIAPFEKEFDEFEGVKVVGFNPRKSNAIKDRFRPLKELLKKAEECRADIFHCHEPDALYVGLKMKKKFGSKVIYDAHEYHSEHFAERYNGIVSKVIYNLVDYAEKYLATRADMVFTVCDELVDKFKQWGCETYFVPNYAKKEDVLFFEENLVVKELKERNYKVGVFVGGMYTARGLIEMIEANKLANDKGTKIAMVFIGWGDQEYLEELKNLIKVNNMDEYVNLLGKMNHKDILNILSQCDFGIVNDYPDKRNLNSFDIKTFEYMECGLPIISSKLPGMVSLLHSEQCGVICNSFNPIDIASALLEICTDEDKAMDMSKNARIAFENKFNWSIVERNISEAYKRLEDRVNV